MDKIVDIFNGKMPSVVGGIAYIPQKSLKQFKFKDDFEPTSFYNYYGDFRETNDELSLEGLGENPIVNQIEEEPLYTETSHKIDTPTLTYSRKLLSGNHQFKTPEIDVGYLQEFLDILAKNNIYVRVTSGTRPGAITSSGNRSRHDDGHAIDITPIEGETWEDLVNKIKHSPEVLNYMVNNNVGWLEEINKEDQKKYNASNANVHISIAGNRGYGETAAINGRIKVFGI